MSYFHSDSLMKIGLLVVEARLLRIRSAHLKILRFPMGGAY